MKRSDLRRIVQAEIHGLAATVSTLKSGFDPLRGLGRSGAGLAYSAKIAGGHIVRNPLLGLVAGVGLGWFFSRKRARQPEPKPELSPESTKEVLGSKAERGTEPHALRARTDNPAPATGSTDVFATGIAALAIGVAAAALLPRSNVEDKALGDAGKKLRDVAAATSDEAMSLVGDAVRKKGVEILWHWEAAAKDTLDSIVAHVARRVDEIVPKSK